MKRPRVYGVETDIGLGGPGPNGGWMRWCVQLPSPMPIYDHEKGFPRSPGMYLCCHEYAVEYALKWWYRTHSDHEASYYPCNNDPNESKIKEQEVRDLAWRQYRAELRKLTEESAGYHA